MFRLHHLNGMLLVFILFWAASTYIFNVVLSFSSNKSWKVHFARGFEISYNYINNLLLTSSIAQLQDMEIWETIGLWHYPIPGYYLLAQFCLGFLFAMCNLVNSSVLLCITGQEQLTADESVMEGDRTRRSE